MPKPKPPRTPQSVVDAFRALADSGSRIGVALSAGADSTLALMECVERLGAARVVALHYDHALRGHESDEDARAAAALAATLCVPMLTERRAPGMPADEASLRRDRIDFLHRMAREHSLEAIVTGHHADDVAETLLMRLARGSGAAGLAAPRPVSQSSGGPRFLRPLLYRKKQAILDALRERGATWREDSGNANADVARRNAVRLLVTPAWKQFAGPDPVAGARRTRDLLQEDDEALETWATTALAEIAPGTTDENWTRAQSLPRAVTRRILHRRLIDLKLHAALSATAFDSLLSRMTEGRRTRTSVPGGFLEFDTRRLVFTREHAPAARPGAPLPVPGAVFWPDGAALTVTPAPDDQRRRLPAAGVSARAPMPPGGTGRGLRAGGRDGLG